MYMMQKTLPLGKTALDTKLKVICEENKFEISKCSDSMIMLFNAAAIYYKQWAEHAKEVLQGKKPDKKVHADVRWLLKVKLYTFVTYRIRIYVLYEITLRL